MNVKRFTIATIVLFIFVYFYNWFVHGYLLSGMYTETSQLWRTPAEMQETLPYLIIFQFVFCLVLAFIFTRNYENLGIQEGVRFGIYFGLFLGIIAATPYVYLPISTGLATAWFFAGLFEGLGSGIVLSLTYQE